MNNFTYYAFISYAHENEREAAWLQKKLEHYKPPSVLRKEYRLTKYIRPVFRDKTDLRTGKLAQSLGDELAQSKYLIVICSPASTHSKWVSKEIMHFQELGRSHQIIPVIVEGEPNNASNECYPEALKQPEDELLGISLKQFGKTKTFLHVLARILNVRFDSLYQRHQRASRQRAFWYSLSALILIGLFSIKPIQLWQLARLQSAIQSSAQSLLHVTDALETTDLALNEWTYDFFKNIWSKDVSGRSALLSQRRFNTKIQTEKIKTQLAAVISEDRFFPEGLEAFRNQLNILDPKHADYAKHVISFQQNLLRYKEMIFDNLNSLDNSRSINTSQIYLDLLSIHQQLYRLESVLFVEAMKSQLFKYDLRLFPEIEEALQKFYALESIKAFEKDYQKILNQKEILLSQKEQLIGN